MSEQRDNHGVPFAKSNGDRAAHGQGEDMEQVRMWVIVLV